MSLELNKNLTSVEPQVCPLDSIELEDFSSLQEMAKTGIQVGSNVVSSALSISNIYQKNKLRILQKRKVEELKNNIKDLNQSINDASSRKERRRLSRQKERRIAALHKEELAKSQLTTDLQVACTEGAGNLVSLYCSVSDPEYNKLVGFVSETAVHAIRYGRQPISESLKTQGTFKERTIVCIQQFSQLLHYMILTSASAVRTADFLGYLDQEDELPATVISLSYLSLLIETTLKTGPFIWKGVLNWSSEYQQGGLYKKVVFGLHQTGNVFKISGAYGKWLNNVFIANTKFLSIGANVALKGIETCYAKINSNRKLETKVIGEHRDPRGHAYFYIHGIMNQESDAIETTRLISSSLGNREVTAILHPTPGFIPEIMQCTWAKVFAGNFQAVDLVARSIMEVFDNNASSKIFIFAHSQGNLLLNSALVELEGRENIELISFGSPILTLQEVIGKQTFYVSENDWVTRACAPIDLSNAHNRSDIILLPAHNNGLFGIDHSILQEPYLSKLKEVAQSL